jgi:hypothetical protein
MGEERGSRGGQDYIVELPAFHTIRGTKKVA